jgi:hypothetical protein
MNSRGLKTTRIARGDSPLLSDTVVRKFHGFAVGAGNYGWPEDTQFGGALTTTTTSKSPAAYDARCRSVE